MAAAMPVLGLLSTVVGAVGQFRAARGQDDAAARQEEAARYSQAIHDRNAANIEQEKMEGMRRARIAQAQEKGEARARAAASGAVVESGSAGLYLNAMSQAHGEEMDWLEQSMRSQVSAEKMQGRYSYLTGMSQADTTRAGAKATRSEAFGGLVSGVGDFGSAYNWWQT